MHDIMKKPRHKTPSSAKRARSASGADEGGISSPPMPTTKVPPEIQVQEYLDIGNTLRHYGNMQFAQLTICMAVSGGGAALLFSKDRSLEGWARVQLELGLALVVLLFLIMSERVTDYWDTRIERAKQLEEKLGFGQYSMPARRRWIPNRRAVALVYLAFFVLFACLAFKDITTSP